MVRTVAIFFLVMTACGRIKTGGIDEQPIFDERSFNFSAEGRLGGAELAIGEVEQLLAEREYLAPPLPGTEEMEDPPADVALAHLISVEIGGDLMLDGKLWSFELDLESDDLSTFGLGSFEPGPSLSIKFQLEQVESDVELEEEAIAGTIEIQKYVDEGGHPESDQVRMGGAVGGVFMLELKSGEHLEGAFHAPFADADIEVD